MWPFRTLPQFFGGVLGSRTLTLRLLFPSSLPPRNPTLDARLTELGQQTGIACGDNQQRRLLHQEGVSFQHPKHTMKRNTYKAALDCA
jgi:hypothetical protein